MKIVIVGIGKMGSWLASTLSLGNEVGVYDSDRGKSTGIKGVVLLGSPAEIENFQPDIVINAVSLGNTLKAFEDTTPYISQKCILADIASIKGDLPSYYLDSGRRFVSTHPMFGPTNANMNLLGGESAIIIRESDEDGKRIFRDIYNKLGLKIYEFSFAEHDSMMAYSLTLPFSSSMVFAGCVDTQAVPGTNFRKHMELAKGLLSEDDNLLSEILFNPKSISQLERITTMLEYLKHIIQSKDYEEAEKLFNKLRANIGK